MSLLLWIIVFSLLGGVLSVLAASVFLLFKESVRERLIPHFVSFAIGALLGAAFLALLPHAVIGVKDFHEIGLTILIGIFTFFLLEKMVIWRHCHSHDCEAHGEHDVKQTSGMLVLIGDGLHNFVDGILIASAFLTDFHLGVVTSLAVAAHEIPQEVGDFAVLLHSGFSRSKAFIFNIIASLTTIVGAVIAYYSLEDATNILPFILAIAASSFIYIAVADLIPGLHKRTRIIETLQQMAMIMAGVIVIYFAHSTLH